MGIVDLFKEYISGLFMNWLVKDARGFSPGKKIKDGRTIYEISMSILGALLVRYARRSGSIDSGRLKILERTQGHFSEHVMFRNFSRSEAESILSDMNNDCDSMGEAVFDRVWDNFFVDPGRKLPAIVREEIVAHIAMFQRIDSVPIDDLGRVASVRDVRGLLFGSVGQDDIEKALSKAAGYTPDW